MAGAVLSVVVTIDGVEYTDLTAAVAGEDKSAEVELVDDYGLQSDGTGIIGDRLTVTYGADFGTPTNISWYKNGKVVQTNSVGDVVNNGLSMVINAGGRWGVGTYKVTITNTDGDMATTNEIVITDKEEAATIVDFEIEDDYTDGTDLTYATSDTRAVASVTLSKNYAGRFRVYRATDTKYGSPLANDTLVTTIVQSDRTASQATTNSDGVGAIADQASVITPDEATPYQVVNAATIGAGFGYIHDDGTVTYKWTLNDTGVVRGVDYVVTFDQNSISTDTPGTGTANVSEKATAPYVTVPAKIAVTKVANGVKPEITFQDSDGNSLGWFGYKNTAAGADQNAVAADTVTTLANIGVEAARVYRATSKTNDPKNATVTSNESSTAGSVLKGVWSATGEATTAAYWFAQVELTKGIYGAEKITLTSEAADNAQDAAGTMTLKESSTTGTTAVVTFTNNRCAGKLYIVQGTGLGGNGLTTPSHTTAATALIDSIRDAEAEFDPTVPTTYVKAVDVAKGAEKVEIENAISAPIAEDANTTAIEALQNIYMAIYIPEDEVNYGMVKSEVPAADTAVTTVNWASNASNPTGDVTLGTAVANYGVIISPELKSFKLGGSAATITGSTASATTATPAATEKYLVAVDQFGANMAFTAPMANTAAAMTNETPTQDVGVTATMAITNSTGAATTEKLTIGFMTMTPSGSNTVGATYSIKLSTGQTLKCVCAGAGAAGASTWKVSLS